MPSPTYSIVVPVFNEAESLPELHRRLTAVMKKLGKPWELILVNDGSSDASPTVMRALAARDPRVRVLRFARNFGHQIAVTAGLDASKGRAVIVIDADLQDPPEVIPDLVAKWKEGFELVFAIRRGREGDSWFKKTSASLFYRLIFRITDVPIPLDTGDFRLLDRKVVEVLNSMRERHRFLRGMGAWVGFRQVGVLYDRQARFAGETKYPFRKMLRLALNAITGFSYLPLQMATYVGFVSAGLAALAIPVVIILRIAGVHAFEGQATTLLAVLFLGGVQLIGLGILGEYVGRIYDEVKGRPLYILDEPADAAGRGAGQHFE